MPVYRLGTLEASEALIKDLYIDIRSKVNFWSNITSQTPQARMGYVGQHLVSVVTGYPGGKSGARGADLEMDNGSYGEIKTCYRVDQLGKCKVCDSVVSSLEIECSKCGSKNIDRKDDSKWLISLRNDTEFAEVIEPKAYYFVLFEFADSSDDIEVSIWKVDPLSKGFAYCMVDYYLNIRTESNSKAPFNMWPHDIKFLLTKPLLIYKAIIKNNGEIETVIFPPRNDSDSDTLTPYPNTLTPYPDELKPLPEYSSARTITIDAINRVISRLSDNTHYAQKQKLAALESLERIRNEKEIPNETLCDMFAEEIYLPRIKPVKDKIPNEIRSRYPELQ